KELPPGRGFMVKAVSAKLVQIAMADVDGLDGHTAQEQLDTLIGGIRASYQPAKWSYYAQDVTVLEKAIRGEAPEAAAAARAPGRPTAARQAHRRRHGCHPGEDEDAGHPDRSARGCDRGQAAQLRLGRDPGGRKWRQRRRRRGQAAQLCYGRGA